jgi:hypothetical protein
MTTRDEPDPIAEARIAKRAVPRAVLVSYDASRRAQRTLADAIELCRDTGARLGVAVVRQREVVFVSPWVFPPPPPCQPDACGDLLRRLPDDLSVTYLSSDYPAGMREIAEFAKRLDCECVLLPYSGWRARRATRVLARRGLAVLVGAERVPD